MTEPAKYEKWKVVKPIGRGGQGQVYLVRDASAAPNSRERWKSLQKTIATLVGASEVPVSRYDKAAAQLADEIRQIASESQAPRGALKELLPIDEGPAENEAAALARMKDELSTLESVKHSSLVRVLDSNLDQKWFVMEYFERGTLSDHLEVYKGRVLDALTALRPVVDAVSALHAKGVVHRDIKPDNIFVAPDDRLVLADCGLAFRHEHQERLTVTFENVGTRDFQPPWSQGKRLADVKPTFDVYSLAKVLWTMISGLPKFQLWYFDHNGNDLRQMFRDEPACQFVHNILGKCVVQFEKDMGLHDAGDLLGEIDSTIAAVSQGCQLPGLNRSMRCRFCGIGRYKGSSSYAVAGNVETDHERMYLLCDHCGHLESFLWPRDKRPAVWDKSE